MTAINQGIPTQAAISGPDGLVQAEWYKFFAFLAVVPTGGVIGWAANTVPTGWLVCDGSAISRVGYAKLFAAIGTTFGPGDGSTTFNLPNQMLGGLLCLIKT